MPFLKPQGQGLFKLCITVQCHERWKITPLYLCSLNLVYFGQKEPIKKMGSCHIWNYKSIFKKTFDRSSVSWETLYDLNKRNPSKCKISVLTKTRNDLKRPETTYNEQKTTWNDLQRTRNNLKRPTTSKKWIETTYNEQETTWNNLKRAWNDMKQPTVSKKRHETTYREQETTWNDLQQARSNLKRPAKNRF